MSDSVTVPSQDELTLPQGTDPSPGPGNADNGSMAGLTWGSSETGLLSGGYPWIPAVLVACSMVLFLSLSFYSHHRRVRRKRRLLMDYLSVLLYSGAGTRGRSVSILCNTNSLALSQLGKSFRIKRDKKMNHDTADFLRDRFLMDLVEFSNSHKHVKNVLKRYISAPSESKFRQVANQMITLNRATRLGKGDLSTLARNLSVPEDLDHCDLDFPSSLSEIRTSITQGVLLNPQRMQNDDADYVDPANGSDTITESLSERSYDNSAFPSLSRLSKDLAPITIHSNTCFNRDDDSGLPVKNPRPSELHTSETSPLQSLWFLNESLVPAPCPCDDVRLPEDRWRSDSPRHEDVSKTLDSLLPVYVPSREMSQHFSGKRGSLGRSMLPYNIAISQDCRTKPPRHKRRLFYPYTGESHCGDGSFGEGCYYHPDLPYDLNGQAEDEQPSSDESYSGKSTLSASPPLLEKGICTVLDPQTDQDKRTNPHDRSCQQEVYGKNLDGRNIQHSCQSCESQKRQIFRCCRSLEDSLHRSPRRFPLLQGINSGDYNPMFCGDTCSSLISHRPESFLPAFFSHRVLVDGKDMTQRDPLLPPVAAAKGRQDPVFSQVRPGHTTNPVATKSTPSKQHNSGDAGSRARGRRFWSRAMSTQSTRSLISETPSPCHSFSRENSSQPPPTQPQRFTSFEESPVTSAVTTFRTITCDRHTDPHDYHDVVSENCSVRFLSHDGLDEDHPSRQTQGSDEPSTCTSMTLQPLCLTASGGSDRRRAFYKNQTHTLMSSDSLSSADHWPSVRQPSHVHRLPRFQIRSGMNQPRKCLAQHYDTAPGVDAVKGADHSDQENQQASSWTDQGPLDTQI